MIVFFFNVGFFGTNQLNVDAETNTRSLVDLIEIEGGTGTVAINQNTNLVYCHSPRFV